MRFTAIQFFNGINEDIIPQVRLTKGKDGPTGQAFFRFATSAALPYDDLKKIQQFI